jgi:hypothetical protein
MRLQGLIIIAEYHINNPFVVQISKLIKAYHSPKLDGIIF